jgi:DNA-3-methyladenine glycosylase II
MLASGRTLKQLRRYGGRWRPYRSVAAWYLWRAVERVQPKVT